MTAEKVLEYQCPHCGELYLVETGNGWKCRHCNRDVRPEKSFSDLWAEGHFQKPRYFVLTARIREWLATGRSGCLVEPVPPVTGRGTGIITCKHVIYIYSDLKLADKRARTLGEAVKPLKLTSLSYFAAAASDSIKYVDMVLDERWHIEAYTCRNSNYTCVTHLNLSTAEYMFQLMGCRRSGNLQWIPCAPYDVPNHPQEHCRPITFPGRKAMHDYFARTPRLETEVLVEPESLQCCFIADKEFVTHEYERQNGPRGGAERVTDLYARPFGHLAFARTRDEPVLLTRGEGTWIPVASGTGPEEYSVFPWAQWHEPYARQFFNDPERIIRGKLSRGTEWYVNAAFAEIELAQVKEERRALPTKRLERVMKYVDEAIRQSPGHFAANELKRALDSWPGEELPGIIHADRIGWFSRNEDFKSAVREFDKAVRFKPNFATAFYLMAYANHVAGHEKESERLLEEVVKLDPSHARAIFALAAMEGAEGNVGPEMEGYRKAAQADPYFAEPLYNLGRTYADNGNPEKAAECYLRAIERDPHHVKALEDVATMFFRNGDCEKADSYMLRLLEADPYRNRSYLIFARMAVLTRQEDLLSRIMDEWKQYVPYSEDLARLGERVREDEKKRRRAAVDEREPLAKREAV